MVVARDNGRIAEGGLGWCTYQLRIFNVSHAYVFVCLSVLPLTCLPKKLITDFDETLVEMGNGRSNVKWVQNRRKCNTDPHPNLAGVSMRTSMCSCLVHALGVA